MKATVTLLALAGAFYLSNAQAQVIVAPPPAVVVAPPPPVVVAPPPVVAPAGVAYIAPVGVAPAPGYLWRYHVGAGWGWWHPHYGWHAGYYGWHGAVGYHHWGYRRG